MREIDRSDMLHQLWDLPDQLLDAAARELDVDAEVDNICICGLGGSAIGGDILTDHLGSVSDFPCVVARGVELPHWVDDRTLTIMVSYSGDTKETLAMFRQAVERGCNIVGGTSGGKLLDHCVKENIQAIKVPTGIQPRAALGHLLGSMGAIVEGADIAPVATELVEMVPDLKAFREAIGPEISSDKNLAKQIAIKLNNHIPAVYSSRSIRSAAVRWQTQINENAKQLALSGEIPEINHNQIVGWLEGSDLSKFVPVFLRDLSDEGMMRDIVNATVEIFRDKQLDPIVVDLDGGDHFRNMMMGVILGDFISFYLAMLKGIDPTPVASIKELKKRLI